MSHRTRTITTSLLAAALAAALASPAGAAPGGRSVVEPANAGFGDGLAGWTVTGDASAATTESGGRTGDRLTHWSDTPYEVTTSQRLGRLGTGWWTASAWV